MVTGNCGQGYVDVAHWLGLVDTLGLGVNVCHLIPTAICEPGCLIPTNPGN